MTASSISPVDSAPVERPKRGELTIQQSGRIIGAMVAVLWAIDELRKDSHRRWVFVGFLVAAVAGTVAYAGLARAMFGLAVWRFEREWEGRR